jgi:hypothetical protein
MNRRIRPILLLLLFSSLIPHPSSLARADGGAIRLRERAGAYQVTIFTSPTPLRAGLVDVSVLVQDAATGECLPEARVILRLTSRGTGAVLESQATAEAATNKLLRAAAFQLPQAGRWDVDAAIDGPRGRANVRLEFEANEPPPRWLAYWPWFSWPAGAVALFAVHEALTRRRVSRRNRLPS